MTQPKTDLAYLRNEKATAEQKLRSCQDVYKRQTMTSADFYAFSIALCNGYLFQGISHRPP